jgi:hypothetical protein
MSNRSGTSVVPARRRTSTLARASARRVQRYCGLRPERERVLPPDVHADRLRLIRVSEKKWVNGTLLHYYFFDRSTDGENVVLSNGQTRWVTWTASEAEKNVVRRAFQTWKELGIGLEFREVARREEAELRIGFMLGDGAWSYVGRDVLDQGTNERTMNFGWRLSGPGEDLDTALHEIGHALGFPHEHQNPHAGIVWNEAAVYAALAAPPNSWDHQKTYDNIIKKLAPDTVQGSSWDPDSIMHYPFEAGLIDRPVEYRAGLTPAGGLSARDATWAKTFYPALSASSYTKLEPFRSIELAIGPREQRNFTIEPQSTRTYEIQTFGESDTVMVLFEDVNGEFRYVTADDDSGLATNAKLRVKLQQGKRYALRVRLYYTTASGRTAVMMW